MGKDGAAVDNVKTAQEQTAAAGHLVEQLRASFQPMARPDGSAGILSQLDRTIRELRGAAQQAGVGIPADYYFTFQGERNKVSLPPREYAELPLYLAEVKGICDILFAAKINSLDSLQREMISGVETNGPDFVSTAVTNTSPLVDMTFYKANFQCFSGELAAVLSELASSPHGYIVRFVDVDPGVSAHSNKRPAVPGRGARPVTYLNEGLLKVTLSIAVAKPKPPK